MPSIALTSATPSIARRGGSVKVIRLMPSGTAATDSPVTLRPMTSGTRLWLSAQISEPATRKPAETISISRLPNRSPSRPAIGTATAAASNAEVSSHSVLVAELPVSVAISGSTGTSIDKMTETMKPDVAIIASAAISLPDQPSASLPAGPAGPTARTSGAGALAGGSSIITAPRPVPHCAST